MTNLSPAAQAFWGDAIRRVLTLISAALVTHGVVTQGAATAYTQELVGVILAAGVAAWGQRAVYWTQIRAIVGRSLPMASSHAYVEGKVNALQAENALPSVFTPEHAVPTLSVIGGAK